jgi:hypothetical protein
MGLLAIQHLRYSPHHPQSNRKLEQFNETLKTRLNLPIYTRPDHLHAGWGRIKRPNRNAVERRDPDLGHSHLAGESPTGYVPTP